MNFLIIIAAVLLVIYLMFRMNNIRTKTAYVFIILGALFFLLTIYVIFSDRGVNWEIVDDVSGKIKNSVFLVGSYMTDFVKFTGNTVNEKILNKDSTENNLERDKER